MRNLDRANLLGAATGATMAIGGMVAPVEAMASSNASRILEANGPALSHNLGRASLEFNTVLQEMGPNSCLAISIGEEMGISPKDSSERAQFITSGGLRFVAKVVAKSEAYPEDLACHNTSVSTAINSTSTQEAFTIAMPKVPTGSRKDFKKTGQGYVLKNAALKPGNEVILSKADRAKSDATIKNSYNVNVSYGLNKFASKEKVSTETCSANYIPDPNTSASVSKALQADINSIRRHKFAVKGEAGFNGFNRKYISLENSLRSSLIKSAYKASNGAPLCLEDLHPENLNISSEVQSTLNMHEGWLPELGCSAWIFYNGQTPVGIATARHCFLDSKGNLDLVQGSNGQPEINLGEPLIVALGPDTGTGDMSVVGTIDSLYIVPDNSNDFVYGTFTNESIPNVVAAEQAQSLSQQQINSLKTGTEIVDEGMPGFQGSNTGLPLMQTTAESLMGFESINVTNSAGNVVAQEKGLVAADIKNQFNNTATPGYSGSGDAVVINNQPYFAAIATGISDINTLPSTTTSTGNANQVSYQNSFAENLSGYSSISLESYTPPSANNGAEDVTINVPGGNGNGNFAPSAELLCNELANDFFNPAFTREVINGLVYADGTWINNPVYAYDPSSDTFITAGYNIQTGLLSLVYFPNSANYLQYFIVYPQAGESAPSLTTSTGEVTVNSSSDSYSDADGLTFGQTYPSSPTPSGTAYNIAMGSNNQPYFTPSSNGIKTGTAATIKPNESATKQTLTGSKQFVITPAQS